eukprot:jgi/Ulvmu1/9905/UM057_0062.1
MRSALSGDVDPAYQEGSAFLKSLDPEMSPAEVARVLDIAMNPDSIFVSFRDKKRAKNSNARRLSVRDDMEPAVAFLRGQGLTDKQVASVIIDHPPTLSYSIPDRLQPFVDCLNVVGIDDVAQVICERPSILGLEAQNVKSIVDYLQSRETSQEDISKFLRTSI